MNFQDVLDDHGKNLRKPIRDDLKELAHTLFKKDWKFVNSFVSSTSPIKENKRYKVEIGEKYLTYGCERTEHSLAGYVIAVQHMFHEYRHVKQMTDEWNKTPSKRFNSEEEIMTDIVRRNFIRNYFGSAYTHNYKKDPGEMDAEFYSIKETIEYFKDNSFIAQEDVKKILVDFMLSDNYGHKDELSKYKIKTAEDLVAAFDHLRKEFIHEPYPITIAKPKEFESAKFSDKDITLKYLTDDEYKLYQDEVGKCSDGKIKDKLLEQVILMEDPNAYKTVPRIRTELIKCKNRIKVKTNIFNSEYKMVHGKDINYAGLMAENADRKIVKLTGKPVSDEMQDILERLDRKENVLIEEIEDTPEIKTARRFVPVAYSTIERKGREEVQDLIYDAMLSMGSAVKDSKGNTQYEGPINHDARLDIVIGLSASGKSSALSDVLSKEFNSRVIDNDMAKSMIPEYNNGWGAGIVHKESQMISDWVYGEALKQHDNIVLPKVGSDPKKLLNDYIIPAKEQGYEVNLHFIDLDRNKAMGRMLNRFISKGRFLDPNLIDKYAPSSDFNKVAMTYEKLKDDPHIDGSSKWDNDVPKGQRPVLVEYRNLEGNFIDNALKGEQYGEHQSGNRSKIYSTADLRDNRRDGGSIQQEQRLGQGTQGRMAEAYTERAAQSDEYSIPDKIKRRGTAQDGCIRDAGPVGEAGVIDAQYPSFADGVAGIPLDDGGMAQ